MKDKRVTLSWYRKHILDMNEANTYDAYISPFMHYFLEMEMTCPSGKHVELRNILELSHSEKNPARPMLFNSTNYCSNFECSL